MGESEVVERQGAVEGAPVEPMERLVTPEDIRLGEQEGRRRSQDPHFMRFFMTLNAGLILTAPNERRPGRTKRPGRETPNQPMRRGLERGQDVLAVGLLEIVLEVVRGEHVDERLDRLVVLVLGGDADDVGVLLDGG